MTEAPNRRRGWLAVALVATLAATAWVSQNGGPDDEADAVAEAQPAGPRMPSRREHTADTDTLQWRQRAQRTVTDPTQNAFANRNWTPPVVVAPVAPPPPPSAPPLPFTFLGKLQEGDNGDTTVYLTQGEQVYSVRKGDVIEQAWRVDSTSGEQIVLTYLPMSTRQTLSFGNN